MYLRNARGSHPGVRIHWYSSKYDAVEIDDDYGARRFRTMRDAHRYIETITGTELDFHRWYAIGHETLKWSVMKSTLVERISDQDEYSAIVRFMTTPNNVRLSEKKTMEDDVIPNIEYMFPPPQFKNINSIPPSKWNSATVASYLHRPARFSDANLEDPILDAVTHYRRYGPSRKFEFCCVWRHPSGRKVTTWQKWIDVFQMPSFQKILSDADWDMDAQCERNHERVFASGKRVNDDPASDEDEIPSLDSEPSGGDDASDGEQPSAKKRKTRLVYKTKRLIQGS